MVHLYDLAWRALQLLPQIKEFRAKDVPLDARRLIKKKGCYVKAYKSWRSMSDNGYRNGIDRTQGRDNQIKVPDLSYQ
jgi:hypothetical protein